MVNNGWYMLILAMNEDKLTVCYKQWPIQSWFTDESSDFQHSYISLPEGKPLHPLSKWCNQQDKYMTIPESTARNRRKSKHLKAHPEKNKKLISEVPACQSENLRKQLPWPWPSSVSPVSEAMATGLFWTSTCNNTGRPKSIQRSRAGPSLPLWCCYC